VTYLGHFVSLTSLLSPETPRAAWVSLKPTPLFVMHDQGLYRTLSLRVEQSFNTTSTASRLMFVHPLPFLHHHVRPHHRNSLPTTWDYAARSPSPPVRDVGSINNAPQQGQGEENGSQLHPPVPATVGSGRLINTRWRSWGGRNAKGGPRSGKPSWYVSKTNHDFGRGLFSSFCSPFPASDRFYAQHRRFKALR